MLPERDDTASQSALTGHPQHRDMHDGQQVGRKEQHECRRGAGEGAVDAASVGTFQSVVARRTDGNRPPGERRDVLERSAVSAGDSHGKGLETPGTITTAWGRPFPYGCAEASARADLGAI